MQMTPRYARAYYQLIDPDLSEERLESCCAALLKRLKDDPDYAQRARIAVVDGELVAAVCAAPWMQGDWQAAIHGVPALGHEDMVGLLEEWHGALRALPKGPTSLLARRLVKDEPVVESALRAAGWAVKGERFEFRTPVAELPGEEGSPFEWRTLAEVGRELAVDVFGRAGPGPEWDDDDDPALLIDSYLNDDELAGDPSCIQIGTIENEAAAFICAQTDRGGGWCTVTFMGLLPEFRGRGLGQHLHRHGFAMFREQGGRDYHGGTSGENTSMLRLFEKNGCRPHRHLREWKFRF